jgi:hypothetical protein
MAYSGRELPPASRRLCPTRMPDTWFDVDTYLRGSYNHVVALQHLYDRARMTVSGPVFPTRGRLHLSLAWRGKLFNGRSLIETVLAILRQSNHGNARRAKTFLLQLAASCPFGGSAVKARDALPIKRLVGHFSGGPGTDLNQHSSYWDRRSAPPPSYADLERPAAAPRSGTFRFCTDGKHLWTSTMLPVSPGAFDATLFA